MGGYGADCVICAICSAPQLTAIGYIRSLPALIHRSNEEHIFRVFVGDILSARYQLPVYYSDLISDQEPPPDPQEGRKRIMNKLSQ